jgi:hypothetical protein
MERRKNSKVSESKVRSRCESCLYSVTCEILEPCREYAPAINSSMSTSVEVEFDYRSIGDLQLVA